MTAQPRSASAVEICYVWAIQPDPRNREDALRRREFFALVGSAAFAWPSSAHAQQPAMPVVGFLDSSAGVGAKLTAFYEGLKTEGFVRNRNVTIEYHSAESDYDRLPALAADLVIRKVTVIAAAGVSAALAAKSATTAIPIIFALETDPVRIGLLPSLNHPDANITGVTDMALNSELKRLELLHEMIPSASGFAALVNPANPNASNQTRDVLAAAGNIGLRVNILNASAESDFDKAMTAAVKSRAGGLIITNDELFNGQSAQLAALVLSRSLPAVFQYRDVVAAGGLMSYGSSLGETYHQVGAYAGLILKGGNAADLPVYQSTHADFMINMKTAKALGIPVPQTLIAAAKEVIE
jgi:putative ABC transport system substrate-binding protein